MKALRTVAAVLIFAGPVLAFAPAAQAATDCADLSIFTISEREGLGITATQCIPKTSGQTDAQAVEAWLATPGDLRSWEVIPGPAGGSVQTLERAAAATVAPVAGNVISKAGSAIANTVAAGVTMLVGGLAAWWWDPADDIVEVPGVTISPAEWEYEVIGVNGHTNAEFAGVVPNFPALQWGKFGSQNAWGYSFPTVGSGFVSGWPVNRLYLPSGACMSSSNLSTPNLHPGSPVTGLQNSSNTVGYFSTADVNKPSPQPIMYENDSVKSWKCLRLMVNIVDLTTSSVIGTIYAYPQYATTTTGQPTDPYPGRTIEQTVSCTKPDGTSYTYTNTADASVGLTPGTLVPIAGLMCNTGDRATGTTATVKSPGKADTTIINTTTNPTTVKRVTEFTTETIPSCWSTGCTVAPVSDAPAPPLVTEAPPTITSPGVDTPTGTDFCDFSFGDVLNGAIMFKAVGCALSWAFVPAPAALAQEVTEVQQTWNASRVGTFIAPVLAFPTSFDTWDDDAPDCLGPEFTVPFPGLGGADWDQSIRPLNSCSEPMTTVAQYTKWGLTALLVWAGMVMVVNPILLAMGLNTLPSVTGVSDGSDGEMPGQGRMF